MLRCLSDRDQKRSAPPPTRVETGSRDQIFSLAEDSKGQGIDTKTNVK